MRLLPKFATPRYIHLVTIEFVPNAWASTSVQVAGRSKIDPLVFNFKPLLPIRNSRGEGSCRIRLGTDFEVADFQKGNPRRPWNARNAAHTSKRASASGRGKQFDASPPLPTWPTKSSSHPPRKTAPGSGEYRVTGTNRVRSPRKHLLHVFPKMLHAFGPPLPTREPWRKF